MLTKQTFGQAVEALKEGKIINRSGWGRGVFVFRQVPSAISLGTIPNMTSLPQAVKDAFVKSGIPINYRNQFCIVYPSVRNNTLHGWQPSGTDILANDWEIQDDDYVAGVAPVSTP